MIKRNGGESGIRTHGRVSSTHAFQACSFNRAYMSPLVLCELQKPNKLREWRQMRAAERFGAARGVNNFRECLLQFCSHSGVVQLVAHGLLEPRILVRVQAPEPFFYSLAVEKIRSAAKFRI